MTIPTTTFILRHPSGSSTNGMKHLKRRAYRSKLILPQSGTMFRLNDRKRQENGK
jgi:hypothetical protein